jgi:hypothetical protein
MRADLQAPWQLIEPQDRVPPTIRLISIPRVREALKKPHTCSIVNLFYVLKSRLDFSDTRKPKRTFAVHGVADTIVQWRAAGNRATYTRSSRV